MKEQMSKNKKLKIVPIFPNDKYVKYMGEVTTVQAFDKGLINEDGLYSEKIFGPVGSDTRMVRFGFIDLGVSVVHPLIWKAVTRKKLYNNIINGSVYVTFDNTIKDFVVSDIENGHTGFNYFFTNLPRVKFVKGKSLLTNDNIKLYEQYKDNIYYDKLLILPAGLRDYSVGKDGRFTEVEINEFYTSVISMSGLTKSISKAELNSLDDIRLRMQEKVNDLYDYLMGMIDGKHKFINGSFTATNIDYATRNVASGIPMTIDDLEDVEGDINTAQIGLMQFVKSISPFIHYEWENIINNIYFVLGQDALLVDKESMSNVRVGLGGKTLNKFTTVDGVENIMSNLIDDDFKNSPIDVAGHWLMLVHDKGDEFILYEKIDETIPEDIKKELRPITYGELFFIMAERYVKRTRGLITRYPVASELSIYPSKVLLNSTHTYREVKLHIKDELGLSIHTIKKFPIVKGKWVPGISPSSTRLPKLGLDYDGDKLAFIALFTDNSNGEVDKILSSITMYIDNEGNEIHDVNDNVCKRTFLTLTTVNS